MAITPEDIKRMHNEKFSKMQSENYGEESILGPPRKRPMSEIANAQRILESVTQVLALPSGIVNLSDGSNELNPVDDDNARVNEYVSKVMQGADEYVIKDKPPEVDGNWDKAPKPLPQVPEDEPAPRKHDSAGVSDETLEQAGKYLQPYINDVMQGTDGFVIQPQDAQQIAAPSFSPKQEAESHDTWTYVPKESSPEFNLPSVDAQIAPPRFVEKNSVTQIPNSAPQPSPSEPAKPSKPEPKQAEKEDDRSIQIGHFIEPYLEGLAQGKYRHTEGFQSFYKQTQPPPQPSQPGNPKAKQPDTAGRPQPSPTGGNPSPHIPFGPFRLSPSEPRLPDVDDIEQSQLPPLGSHPQEGKRRQHVTQSQDMAEALDMAAEQLLSVMDRMANKLRSLGQRLTVIESIVDRTS
jgi:hypothetical protein